MTLFEMSETLRKEDRSVRSVKVFIVLKSCSLGDPGSSSDSSTPDSTMCSCHHHRTIRQALYFEFTG